MPRISDGKLAIIVAGLFAAWIFVVLPFFYSVPRYDPAHNQSAHDATAQGSQSEKPKESFWQRATDDPVAVFTLALVIFTFVLAVSTIGLWIVTRQGVKTQIKDTRILQRAYLRVEPGGIHSRGWNEPGYSHINITNVGHLPARHVKWTIKVILSESDQFEPTALVEGEYGDNTLPPGTLMTQGGVETISFQTGTDPATNLRKDDGHYAYVWGVVSYEDGFKKKRWTRFCHRYNGINVESVLGRTMRTSAERGRYEEPTFQGLQINEKWARYHKRGNETDESDS